MPTSRSTPKPKRSRRHATTSLSAPEATITVQEDPSPSAHQADMRISRAEPPSETEPTCTTQSDETGQVTIEAILAAMLSDTAPTVADQPVSVLGMLFGDLLPPGLEQFVSTARAVLGATQQVLAPINAVREVVDAVAQPLSDAMQQLMAPIHSANAAIEDFRRSFFVPYIRLYPEAAAQGKEVLVKVAVEHYLIEGILFDLNVPNQAQRHVNGVYLLKEEEWILLANKANRENDPEPFSKAYLAHRSARNPNHYTAMMLIEAVEIGALLVKQQFCDRGTASLISWIFFTLKAPFYLREENYEKIITPHEFQSLIDQWTRNTKKSKPTVMGVKGSRRSSKWDLLSDILARISHRLALDSIKRMWRLWRKKTNLPLRLHKISQWWPYVDSTYPDRSSDIASIVRLIRRTVEAFDMLWVPAVLVEDEPALAALACG